MLSFIISLTQSHDSQIKTNARKIETKSGNNFALDDDETNLQRFPFDCKLIQNILRVSHAMSAAMAVAATD